jgi:hypothetical protein
MSYNYQPQWDSPNYTPYTQTRAVWGRDRVITEIAIHWWGDPNTNPTYEGVVATLINPARQASAHYVATGTGRRVACLVSPDDNSWATNQANPWTISIEADPRCRDEDYDVVAELIANIRSAYGALPLVPHNKYVATQCPGNWDLDRLNALANTKDGSGDWGVVTNKGQAKIVATAAEVQQAYLDILERPADAGGLKTYTTSGQTIAEVRVALNNSQEHSVLENNKAAAAAKAVADALAADKKRKEEDAQRILDEQAKQAAIDKANKLAAEQLAREAQVAKENNQFIIWLKTIVESITKWLTSWRK